MRVFDVRQIYAKTILTHLYSNKSKYYEKRLNTRITRNANKDLLQIPVIHTTFGQRNFRYFAIKIYNILPVSIKKTDSQKIFKQNVKIWIKSNDRAFTGALTQIQN